MLAIAAIWFLVFLPSVVKRDQDKSERRDEIQKVKAISTAHLGKQARMALAVKRGRSLFATAVGFSFVVGVFSTLDFFATGNNLWLVIGSLATAGLSGFLAVNQHNKYKSLLSQVAVREVPLATPAAEVIRRPQADLTDNSFTPEQVPSQVSLKTGAIEVVTFAEVVPISAAEPSSNIDSIEEILRRRRHVG